jgi:hypothetical protein
LSTNHITMKLTDIDLSSLAEVAAAITLLDSVHVRLATGGVPLPSLPPAEFVVNPAPSRDHVEYLANLAPDSEAAKFLARSTPGLTGTLAADVEKLLSLGVAPMTAQPIATDPLRVSVSGDTFLAHTGIPGYAMPDAASVFGGAPAQSAAPLSHPAPSVAAVAASPTALAAPPASGALPTLQALAALPVASAAAPTAPAAQSSPAGGVELDADGLPWDERIHAGTKRKNADGRWTAKRGINDPDLVPRVVAQLRAQMAAGGVVTPQPAAPAPLAALTSATPAPLLGGKPTPTTFADFMTAATVEVQRGTMTAVEFGQACEPFGGAKGLAANPAAIPMAWAALKAQHPGML